MAVALHRYGKQSIVHRVNAKSSIDLKLFFESRSPEGKRGSGVLYRLCVDTQYTVHHFLK